MTALTQRVQVGSFYTNGRDLVEVIDRGELGDVSVRDSSTGHTRWLGIDAFRRQFWLAKQGEVLR